ncbi:MAG: 4Fe-4S binding protein, partial [Planctomycetota bacterium]
TMAAAAVLTLFFGRLFCRSFCPFGALSDLLWKVFRLRLGPSRRMERVLRFLPFLLLWAGGILYAADMLPTDRYDPFAVTFKSLTDLETLRSLTGARAAMGALILVALGGSVLFRRFWCLYLCPTGAAFAVLAGLRLWRAPRFAQCARCGRDPGDALLCPDCSGGEAEPPPLDEEGRHD